MTHPTRRTLLTGAVGTAGIAALGGIARPTLAQAADRDRPRFEVVRDKRSNVHLLWWGERSARFAATELAAYLQMMTGVRVPVSPARLHGDAPRIATTGLCAVHGPAAPGALPTAWLGTADSALSGAVEDSYFIGASDARLVLTGVGPRAVVYAAYSLLEQFGVRFFAPQYAYYEGAAEHVPQLSDIIVADPPANVTSPSFALRRKDVEEGWSINSGNLVALIDWMAKQRFSTLVFPYDYQAEGVTNYDDFRSVVVPELAKRGLTLELGGHGYNSFLSPNQYPQYYTAGCNVFNAHDEAAVTQYVANVVAYLRTRPEVAIFDCWPPDGASWAPATLAAFGTATNAETHIVNALVAALAKESLTVQVERIAYIWTSGLEPPTAGHAFDDSVLIDFAAFGRTYAVPLNDPSAATNASHMSALRSWRATHNGDLAIYDYSRRYRWRSLGNPLTVLATDAALYKSLELTGVESYAEPGSWLQFEALHLFTARSAWDAGLTADRFLTEYLPARFGPGADRMRDYFARTTADPDGLNSQGGGAAFRAQYQAAHADVQAALAQVGRQTATAVVLRRLAAGAEVSLADIDITHYSQIRDDAGAQQAKDRYRQLTQAHRFEGVQLESGYVASRYDGSVSRTEIAREYRAAAWGYLPDRRLTVRSGSEVQLRIVAQPVDFTPRRVEWVLRLPDGITAADLRGTLDVRGAEQPSVTVPLRVAATLPAGTYAATVDFAIDGTALTTAQTTVAVTA
ncbi:DUF4838 domain-containing protein (plasmid) [Embleya sp. NBC_00888]|uniref:DUF4838 domain-containing protein n=1 Tax=Embleya sp. NBC_00888 TaxID=2975960 RepID=UPI002F90A1AD|nr:DUF4838 domain-containing protein [Embleya sp. NBC_00888]